MGGYVWLRTMTHAETLYPVALASLNLGAGWLFYTHIAPAVGVVLVVAGLLVGLAVLGGLVRGHGWWRHSGVEESA